MRAVLLGTAQGHGQEAGVGHATAMVVLGGNATGRAEQICRLGPEGRGVAEDFKGHRDLRCDTGSEASGGVAGHETFAVLSKAIGSRQPCIMGEVPSKSVFADTPADFLRVASGGRTRHGALCKWPAPVHV